MIKILFLVSLVITACYSVSAQISTKNAQPQLSKKKRKSTLGLPVTKAGLIKALSGKAGTEAEIVEIIKTNGVNFRSDQQAESELADAGAGDGIITAVRQNYRVQIGIANGKAINLVTPEYPKAAAAAKVSGAVNVIILIDEAGNVIDASTVSGDPLLADAAVEAALASKFEPFKISGKNVKVTGIVVYNFTR